MTLGSKVIVPIEILDRLGVYNAVCTIDDIEGEFYLIKVESKNSTTYIYLELYQLRLAVPTVFEILLGYITFCIPSAILARVVRFFSKKKGSFLEKKLMNYYYKMEKYLLRRS